MNSTNIEQLMQVINAVDENASVKYSRSTGKFFLSTDIWMKVENNNYYYSSVVCHEYTIEKCIIEAYKKMQGKPLKLEKNGNVKCAELPILILDKENINVK